MVLDIGTCMRYYKRKDIQEAMMGHARNKAEIGKPNIYEKKAGSFLFNENGSKTPLFYSDPFSRVKIPLC